MDFRTEVTKVELETDRDREQVDVIITMKRVPAPYRIAGSPPLVNDLPKDFRVSLDQWLNGVQT